MTQEKVNDILSKLKEVNNLGVNEHHIEMTAGFDWEYITQQLEDSGFKAEPIGITLRITW
jgi:hypothetical protein